LPITELHNRSITQSLNYKMPTPLIVIAIPPLIAMAISVTVIAVLLRSRAAALALDHPNARSLHATPTPRLGGVGIIAGIGAAWGYASSSINAVVLVALGLLVAISLLDDLKNIGAGWRMAAHLASAALASATVLQGQAPGLIALSAVAIAWMINLYNFMDGSDGLAGGMAVIGFGTYGIAAYLAGDISFAVANFAVAASALGFLLFNFPPARIFMGDVGAIPLGGLAAIFNLMGWLRGDWPVWFGIIVFSPFIVDASCTLIKRIARRAKVWQAHREHYYQRLIQHGWGHRKTALAEYTLMLACAGAALVSAKAEFVVQVCVVSAIALAYVAVIYALERALPPAVTL
jgi:UDP-N-acetylmuramyl pentapeptide phosphotransferase/UDP-N-acetylglucosamine-1-phosphate transferase